MVAANVTVLPCAPNNAEPIPGVDTPCGFDAGCAGGDGGTSDGLIRPFDAARAYVAFQPVTYDGALYIANGDIAPGPFDPADWTKYSTEPAPVSQPVAYIPQWSVGWSPDEAIFAVAMPKAIDFPANFAGSQYVLLNDTPFDAEIKVFKNSTQIGTIEFTASVPTFTVPGTTFAVGDVLLMRGVDTAAFEYLSISLVGEQAV